MSKVPVGWVCVCLCGSGAGEETLTGYSHQLEGAFVTPQMIFSWARL